MYNSHFGFRTLPFENVPDPSFFFDVGDFHRVLTRMSDAITAGRGLLAVAGPIGSGKTTVSQKLMAELPESTSLIWLAEPPTTDLELLQFVAEELGADSTAGPRVFLLRDVRKKLLELLGQNRACLMVIDESHLMKDEVLESIRLLNNLEEGASKLIQIILLGQPELMARLGSPEMENFRQRIAGLEQIGTMSGDRLKTYILHRLRIAGAEGEIFTEKALEAIARSTGGVPRRTNSLCDRALRVAYEEGRERVDTEEVHRAATDLGMGRETMHYLVSLRSAEGRGAAGPESRGEGPGSPTEPAVPEETAHEAAALPGPAAGPPPGGRLGLPLLLLLVSLLSLAGSFAFYCSRSPAAGPAACAASLLDSFF